MGAVSDPGWTWEATATIIQAVATVVALGGVAVTFYFSYRAERRERLRAKDEAERSDASAERSEHAAALSIDTMERMAEAIEKLAAKGFGAASTAPPPRVRWSLTHSAGDTYLLTNTGNADAHAVDVSADPEIVMRDRPTGRTIKADEAVRFFALPYGNVRDRTITVTWAMSPGEDSERDVWRYPLPPRPARR